MVRQPLAAGPAGRAGPTARAPPEEQATTAALRLWLARKGEAFQPAQAARYHLLRLQAEALEAEAAALGALLQAPAS
jgi:hypothetical protein